jgi:hypothetical protein
MGRAASAIQQLVFKSVGWNFMCHSRNTMLESVEFGGFESCDFYIPQRSAAELFPTNRYSGALEVTKLSQISVRQRHLHLPSSAHKRPSYYQNSLPTVFYQSYFPGLCMNASYTIGSVMQAWTTPRRPCSFCSLRALARASLQPSTCQTFSTTSQLPRSRPGEQIRKGRWKESILGVSSPGFEKNGQPDVLQSISYISISTNFSSRMVRLLGVIIRGLRRYFVFRRDVNQLWNWNFPFLRKHFKMGKIPMARNQNTRN